jgi:hypothetical protein
MLLWRGSRDGFGAGDFHSHTPTLALIRDRGDFQGLRAGGVGIVVVEREIRIRKQSPEGGFESQDFPFPFHTEESV